MDTMEQFWAIADESKLSAQYDADTKVQFVAKASAEELRAICLQYRYFVDKYPRNLSVLIQKLPNGQLQSLLAEILAEELGSGQHKGSHIVWYDRFLRSIGVTDEDIENGIYEENAAVLSEIEKRCKTERFEQLVGLVGMGGECLCQIYLTNMYKYLVQNDYIKSLGKKVDFWFWTYHIGEDDIEHRRLVREAIGDMVLGANGVQELAEGYVYGKESWDMFWENNYKETQGAVIH